MSSFKMFSGSKDEEYNLVDSFVEEQYEIGGVTVWIYAYQGPKGNKGSTDLTMPDYETLGSKVTDIGNLIWMESPERKYSVDAIAMPAVYTVQDANLDMQIPGLFLFETMDLTMPYNMMIKRLGRKVMQGDVIEFANLRDADLLDEDKDGINRFYVVHDAFKAGNGYSHTWFHHIWKIRLVPMVDSPEFKDILGTGENPDDLKNSLSSAQKELAIMDLIVGQADSELPYVHWDNGHINEPQILPDVSDVQRGYEFPLNPVVKQYYIKEEKHELYEWNDGWKLVELKSTQDSPEDGDFYRDDNMNFYQYEITRSKWLLISVETGSKKPIVETSTGFFILYKESNEILQYNGSSWVRAIDEVKLPYVDNKHHHMDHREELPAMSTVPKGKQFPMDPKENSWFLRTDVTPHVLWKFENNKWRKFNYGGRFQWTGTDKHKADFINNREEISPGIPSRQTSADTLKPNIDD